MEKKEIDEKNKKKENKNVEIMHHIPPEDSMG